MHFGLMLSDIGLSDEDLCSIDTWMKIIYAEKDVIKENHIKCASAGQAGAQFGKREELEEAMDDIRRKFGPNKIGGASLIRRE